MILFGGIFVRMLGCLPFFALMTMIKSGMHWFSRFFFGAAISFLLVVLVVSASAHFHNGWILGTYALKMVACAGMSAFFLLFRKLMG